MKTFLIAIIFLLVSSRLFSQEHGQELPEGRYATVRLGNVSLIRLSDIHEFNMDGTPYTAKMEFGRNTFNLEVYEIGTGKMIWSTYNKKAYVKFVLNKDQSKPNFSVYNWITTTGDNKTDVNVTVTSYSVLLSYAETNSKGTKKGQMLVASTKN